MHDVLIACGVLGPACLLLLAYIGGFDWRSRG